MARLAGISSGLSPKGKWFCVVLATLFLLASVPVESPIVKEVLGVAEATAQEKAKKKKRRSLFRILFGKRDKKKKAKQKANRAAAAKKRRKKARRSGGDGALVGSGKL